MSAESEKLLRESTIKELAKSDQEVEKIYQELSKIHLSVKQRITRIKNCTEYVKKRQEYDKLIEDGGVFDKVRKDEMRNYVSQKFKDQQKELLNNFKAGYQLVESIREIIVGEPINYAIAQDNGDELIVYNLNTKQFLRNIHLDRNSLSKYSGNILALLKAGVNSAIHGRGIGKTTYSKNSPLYTSLGRILDSTPLSNTTFNMGHRWELFYYFYNKYGTDEVAITDVEEFFEGYLKSRNNVDWYKGGDVSNIQLKYGDASITSFNSIVTALEKIDYALNAVELSHGQIVQELYTFFTEDESKQTEELGKKLNMAAIQETIYQIENELGLPHKNH